MPLSRNTSFVSLFYVSMPYTTFTHRREKMDQKLRKMEQQQEKQKQQIIQKYNKKEKIAEKLLKQREEEHKIMTEIEAIKKAQRLEEAKRLDRMKAYERAREFENYQSERSRSAFIQRQREMILNSKIEANLQAQVIREKIKQDIKTAKSREEVMIMWV